MRISDTIKTNAPAANVWQAIFDFRFVASCMPGVEKVERIDERTYHAVVRQEIMNITTVFDTRVEIPEAREAEFIAIHAKGRNRLLGELTMDLQARLKPVSEEETEIAYDCDVKATGRLATLGQKAIALKANSLKESFAKSFKEGCEKLKAGAIKTVV